MTDRHLVMSHLHQYNWRIFLQGSTYVCAASQWAWPVRRVLVLFDELGQVTEAAAWTTHLRMRETELVESLPAGVLLFIAGRKQ